MKPTLKVLSLTMLVTLACGTAMAQKIKVPGPWNGQRVQMQSLDQTDAVPFYSNLVTNTCTACNYDTNNGFFILGPTNCFAPGSTQWIAYPFVAAKSGTVKSILASITDSGFCVAGSTKVTLAIYSDACTGIPGTQIGSSSVATAPAAPCALTQARFRTGAPVLTAGTNYWVVATTVSPTQDGTTAVWWEANTAIAPFNLNDGNGWIFNPDGAPGGFTVQ
jgi:hypothetical protein